jgi:hypothetical protein
VVRKSRLRVGSLVGGLASLAVVAAHSLAYLLAGSDPHSRAELLESTGHNRWNLVAAVGVGVFVMGFVRFAARTMWSPATELKRPLLLYVYALPRLAALQLSAFISLEAFERWIAGALTMELLSEPAILIGIVLQLMCAFLSALLLVCLVKVVEVLRGSRFPSTCQSQVAICSGAQPFVPRFHVASGAGTLRGPPATPANV